MGNKTISNSVVTKVHIGICQVRESSRDAYHETPEEINENYMIWLYNKHKKELPPMSQLKGIKFLTNCLTFVPNYAGKVKQYPTDATEFPKTAYILHALVQSVTVDYKNKCCSVCNCMTQHSNFTSRKNKKLLKMAILPYTWYAVCNDCEHILHGNLKEHTQIEKNIKKAKSNRILYICIAIRKKIGKDTTNIIISFLK